GELPGKNALKRGWFHPLPARELGLGVKAVLLKLNERPVFLAPVNLLALVLVVGRDSFEVVIEGPERVPEPLDVPLESLFEVGVVEEEVRSDEVEPEPVLVVLLYKLLSESGFFPIEHD